MTGKPKETPQQILTRVLDVFRQRAKEAKPGDSVPLYADEIGDLASAINFPVPPTARRQIEEAWLGLEPSYAMLDPRGTMRHWERKRVPIAQRAKDLVAVYVAAIEVANESSPIQPRRLPSFQVTPPQQPSLDPRDFNALLRMHRSPRNSG